MIELSNENALDERQAARDREPHREFVYAALALVAAALALILVLGGFVYLAMQGHPTEAKTLLGAGVLGLIASFLRARLRPRD
jgi:hypothetical protein